MTYSMNARVAQSIDEIRKHCDIVLQTRWNEPLRSRPPKATVGVLRGLAQDMIEVSDLEYLGPINTEAKTIDGEGWGIAALYVEDSDGETLVGFYRFRGIPVIEEGWHTIYMVEAKEE